MLNSFQHLLASKFKAHRRRVLLLSSVIYDGGIWYEKVIIVMVSLTAFNNPLT